MDTVLSENSAITNTWYIKILSSRIQLRYMKQQNAQFALDEIHDEPTLHLLEVPQAKKCIRVDARVERVA